MAPLVLPHVQGEHRRIIYTITEYEPLLDSSNMTFQDWVKIAQDIKVRTGKSRKYFRSGAEVFGMCFQKFNLLEVRLRFLE